MLPTWWRIPEFWDCNGNVLPGVQNGWFYCGNCNLPAEPWVNQPQWDQVTVRCHRCSNGGYRDGFAGQWRGSSR